MTDDIVAVTESAWDAWRNGCSVVPVRSDGSKTASVRWEEYQQRRPTEQEMTGWFGPATAAAVICGPVSGGLVMIEMEGDDYSAGQWQHFRDAAVDALGEDRWQAVAACVEMSPSGGPHLLIRCTETTVGNLKLARRRTGPASVEVIMETRGAGGYTVIAGSVGHATGKPWSAAKGGYADIATVTAEELHLILDAARTLDEMPAPVIAPPKQTKAPKRYDGDSVFDAVVADYNGRTTWAGVLAGFAEWAYDRGTTSYWHRIGSQNETGMTTNATGNDTLIVFSTSTMFDCYDGTGPAPSYDRFGAHAVLEHGGDRTEAMRALRDDGYGPEVPRPQLEVNPQPRVDPVTGEIDETPTPSVAVFWADDESDPPEPIDELVTNLIGRGELTVLGAPRAMGKTWATMQLASMCAKGEGSMFGSDSLRVTQPATVVYLQGELGRSGSYGRWRLATNGRPPHVAEVFERLRVRVTSTRTTQTIEGVTTSDEISHALIDHRLEPLLTELGADLLVIDPWATYFGGQENSNDETEAAVDALTQMVRRVDCAGWIVHHITAKATHGNLAEPEDLWRGASRLADAVATRVTMLPHYTPAKAKELGLDRFQARTYGDVHILQRNGPPIPVIHTQLEAFRWGSWTPPDSGGGRPPALHVDDIIGLLSESDDPITKSYMARTLGVSRSTLDDRVGRLIQMGIVEVSRGERNALTVSLLKETRQL